MKSPLKILSTAALLAALFSLAFPQTPGAAQGSPADVGRYNEEILRAREHLAEIEDLLKGNQNEMLRSTEGLKLVGNRIEARRRIVRGLEAEMKRLTAEINDDARRTRQLDTMLAGLKRDYGKLVYAAWKNHRAANATTFLLASRDFNDATRRLSHIRRYNRMRLDRGAEIDSLARSLEVRMEGLNVKKNEVGTLKKDSDATLAEMTADRIRYEDAQKALKADRKKLDAEAKKERDRIASAQKEIDRLMAQQTSRQGAALSEVDIALSGRFEDNKGRLPWPAGGPGTVIDRFGKEVMSDGIENDSKGITVAAPAGTRIKAVFEGKVTSIWSIPTFDKVVAVRSGSYIMLYGNIAETTLKNGDPVAGNQIIGSLSNSAGTGGMGGTQKLLFQIWREKTALDPEEWLRK